MCKNTEWLIIRVERILDVILNHEQNMALW